MIFAAAAAGSAAASGALMAGRHGGPAAHSGCASCTHPLLGPCWPLPDQPCDPSRLCSPAAASWSVGHTPGIKVRPQHPKYLEGLMAEGHLVSICQMTGMSVQATAEGFLHALLDLSEVRMLTSCAMVSLSSARFWRMRRADSLLVTRLRSALGMSGT